MTDQPVLKLEQLQKDLLIALRSWGSLDNNDQNLLAYLQLVKAEQQTLPEPSPSNLRLATDRVLLQGLQVLERQNAQAAAILQGRFVEGQTVLEVAFKLQMTEDEIKKGQQKAIKALAHLLYGQEENRRQEQILYFEAALPPSTYTILFGVDDILRQIVDCLLNPDPPHVLAITGIGGIGKTAVADKTVRTVLRHFEYDEVIWLHVQGQQSALSADLPAELTTETLMRGLARQLYPDLLPQMPDRQLNFQLRQRLKTAPHLIILDNLEAEWDTALLDYLVDLAGPSRFLLTSRTWPGTHPAALALPLPELDATAVISMLRHQAQTAGLTELAQAPDESIEAIYKVVGGNPLALKLIINLTGFMPLAQVLQELTKAQVDQVEAMYRHIYWQTWRTLTDESQTLLKVMPLVAESGSTPNHLLAISQLTEKAFWTAVSELTARSLLEVRGTAQSRRYGIHRLTEAFLQTEIIHWTDLP